MRLRLVAQLDELNLLHVSSKPFRETGTRNRSNHLTQLSTTVFTVDRPHGSARYTTTPS